MKASTESAIHSKEETLGMGWDLTLSEAARLLPSRPHSCSLWRWARKGLRTRTGGRVFLRVVRFGARIYTSRKALLDFGEALAAADAEHFSGVAPAARRRPRTHSARRRAVERAEEDLAGERGLATGGV